MGLPDEYKLPANVNEALGLMGDGVAVLRSGSWRRIFSNRFLSTGPCRGMASEVEPLQRQ
jgi:hypothetical protein